MLRFCDLLLHLYPRAFRDEYGKEMQLAFRDRWRDEAGPWLAMTAIGDVIVNAAGVHAEMLWQDVRYGVRTLLRERSFTIAAASTLALGLGAATAMFTLLHAVLIRPLPFAEPERVVRILDTNQKQRIGGFASSTPNVVSWRERSRMLEAIAGFQGQDFNLSTKDSPERARGLVVLGPFWSVLGQPLIAGRPFDESNHEPGKNRVVILSEEFWRTRFGDDRGIVGTEILLGGEPRTVTGIAPSEIGFRNDVDVFVPVALDQSQRFRGDRRWSVIGRLRAGVSEQQALQEMNRIATDLEREFPRENDGWRVRMMTSREWLVEPAMRQSLGVLFGAVCLLLLISCVNVANLLIARASARRREMSVRLALGANRARLAGQLATESMLLGGIGGGLGIALAWALLRGAGPYLPAGVPGLGRLAIDASVLAFAVCVTLLASLLFGLAPSLIASRGEISEAMQSAVRSASDGARGALLRRGLVVAQLALATILSIGAVLMISTFTRMIGQNFGFKPDHLLTARFSPPSTRYAGDGKFAALCNAIAEEARALPGVAGAGVSSEIPFGPVTTEMPSIASERAEQIRTDSVQTQWRIVTSEYLATLGVPLLQGRWWRPDEDLSTRPVIASQSLVKRLWPAGTDPLGRRVRLGNGLDFMIIGVTGDVWHRNMTDRRPTATIYFPVVFTFWPTMSVTIRTQSDPAAMVTALQAAVRRVDPGLPLFDVRTMETHLGTTASAPRLAALIFALFAALAVLLGSVGIAGLVVYSVTRRRGEIAIRMALGASPARVVREVMRSHLLLCAIGLSLGVAGAWALRPAVASMLFGVEPSDVRLFAGTAIVLGAVALLACLIPARRVTSIDPALALRAE